jgi:ketosteroid isomerase-like protein
VRSRTLRRVPGDDVAVVRSNSAAFSARDVDAMLTHYAPDAVVADRRRVSMGTFRGHEELRPYYASIVGSAAELRERLDVLAEGGGVVVAACELSGYLAGDPVGRRVTVDYGLVVTLRDGLIRRLDVCDDGEAALELSGLSRPRPRP